MSRNRIKMSSIVCGLFFMAAGVLLFAFNAGILPAEYKFVVFSWQMLLAAMGFVFLFSRHKRIAGIIMMMVGGFFLLPKLNIDGLDFIGQNYWAIVLICVGIFIVGSTIFGKQFFRHSEEWHGSYRHSHGWKSYENKAGYIDRNCVFGGSNEKLNLKNFKGGDINSVFGGIELDMSDCQLAEGVHHLELNSVFGGILLYVPIDWKIEINQTQFFGQFADNRPKPEFEVDEKRTLIIEVNAVFGGGEIRCK